MQRLAQQEAAAVCEDRTYDGADSHPMCLRWVRPYHQSKCRRGDQRHPERRNDKGNRVSCHSRCVAQSRLCLKRAPTSLPSGIATTGRVARELPVAPALLIRRELAHWLSLICSEEGPQVAVRVTLFGVTAQKLRLQLSRTMIVRNQPPP